MLSHRAIAKTLYARDKTALGTNSVFRSSKYRAGLIARDQINKLNGDFTYMRYGKAGVKFFIWVTAGDNRVRRRHRRLNGRRFSMRRGADGLFPGQDIQCRCTMMPVL